jgi:hypothetical protein
MKKNQYTSIKPAKVFNRLQWLIVFSLLTMSHNVFSQVKIRTTVPSTSLNVGGNALPFGVSVTNKSGSDETITSVTINQQTGVSFSGAVVVYYNNSPIPAIINGNSININKLIHSKDSIVVAYNAVAGCDAVSTTASNGKATVSNGISVNYTDNSGSQVASANTDSYGIIWPQLILDIPTAPGNQIPVVYKQQTDLYVPIKNLVGSGNASTVQFSITWPDATSLTTTGPWLELTNGGTNGTSISTPPSKNGNTWTYTLKSNDFAGLQLGSSLSSNQELFFHFKILPNVYFANLPVNYTVTFGSSNQQCTTTSTGTNYLTQGNVTPNIVMQSGILNPISLCDSIGKAYIVITNKGAGPAFLSDLTFSFESLIIQTWSDNGIVQPPFSTQSNFQKTFQPFSYDIDGLGGFSDINGDGKYLDIAAGDSVRFEFSYIVPHSSLFPNYNRIVLYSANNSTGLNGGNNTFKYSSVSDFTRASNLTLSGATDLNSNQPAMSFNCSNTELSILGSILGNRNYTIKVTAPIGYSINGGSNVFYDILTANKPINETVQIAVNDNATCGPGTILWEVLFTQPQCPGLESRILSGTFQTNAHTSKCILDTTSNYVLLDDFHLNRVNTGYDVSKLTSGTIYASELTNAIKYTETNCPNPKQFMQGDTIKFYFKGTVFPNSSCSISNIFAQFYPIINGAGQVFNLVSAYFIINGVQYNIPYNALIWDSSTHTYTANISNPAINKLVGKTNIEAYIITTTNATYEGTAQMRGTIGFSCTNVGTTKALDRGDLYTFTNNPLDIYTQPASNCPYSYYSTNNNTYIFKNEYRPIAKFAKIVFTQPQGLVIDKNNLILYSANQSFNRTNIPFSMYKIGNIITVLFDTVCVNFGKEYLGLIISSDTVTSGNLNDKLNVIFYDFTNNKIPKGYSQIGISSIPILTLSTPPTQQPTNKNVSWTLTYTSTNGGFVNNMQWYPLKMNNSLKIKNVSINGIPTTYSTSANKDTIFFSMNSLGNTSMIIRIDALIESCSNDSLISSILRTAFSCSTININQFNSFVSPTFDRTLSVRNTGFPMLPSQPTGPQTYHNLCDTLHYTVDINPNNVDSSAISFWINKTPSVNIIGNPKYSIGGQTGTIQADITKPNNNAITNIIQQQNITQWKNANMVVSYDAYISCDPNSSITDISKNISFQVSRNNLCEVQTKENFSYTPKIRGFERLDSIKVSATATAFDSNGESTITVTATNLYPSLVDSVNISTLLPNGVSFVNGSTNPNLFDFINVKGKSVVWAFKRGQHLAGKETLNYTFKVKNDSPCDTVTSKIIVASSLQRLVKACNSTDSCLVNAVSDSATVFIKRTPPKKIIASIATIVCNTSSTNIIIKNTTANTILSYNIDPVSAGTISTTGTVTFNSSFLGNATIQIKALENGCEQDTSIVVNVLLPATISITALPELSASDAAVTLTATPTGGIWSGDGVLGNTFNPMTAKSGTHTLTYTYSNNGYCDSKAAINVIVKSDCSTSFWIDNKKQCGLGSFDIPVNISDIASCCVQDMKFEINYDNTKLQYNSMTIVKSNLEMTVINQAGKLIVQLYQPLGTKDNFSGGGSLIQLNFTPLTTGISQIGIANAYTNGNKANTVNQMISGTVEIDANPVVTLSPQTTIYEGQQATLTPTVSPVEPYSYKWSLSGQNIATTQTYQTAVGGTYTVTATNVTGCQGTASSVVTVNPIPTFAISQSTSTICIGTSAQLSVSGALSYSWNNGETTSSISVSPTKTTQYSVTGTYANGLTQTASTSITVNQLPTVQATASNPTICSGNQTTVSAIGASTYSWNPSAGTVSPTSTTTYVVTGMDVNGCINTANTTVTVNTTPTVSVSPSTATICSGSNAILTASGATSYTWSNNATTTAITVTPTTNTTYSVTGTSNGCSSIASRIVTVNSIPTVSISPTTSAICLGSNATLTASGVTSYTWSNNATTTAITVTPTTNTTYSVTGTSNGCSSIASRIVTVNSIPTVSISPTTATICLGSNATLTASGATSYAWSNNAATAAITVTPTTNTTYSVTGTSNGCTSIASRIVTVNAIPTVSISPTTATICSGANATLTASGATTYAWSNNVATAAITVSPTTNTTYSVTGVSNGCTSIASRIVTVNAIPTVSISPTTSAICLGSNATLTASGATSYTWSNNATTTAITVTPTINTTYSVTGTSNGCRSIASRQITVNSIPTVSISPTTASICLGTNATLTASGATSYTWNNNATAAATTISPTVNTTYSVTGTSNGCNAIASRIVTVNSVPTVIVNSGTINNNTFTLVATATGTPTLSYNWSNGAISSSTTVSTAGTYTVTVTNGSGCKATANGVVTASPISLPANEEVCNPQTGVLLDVGTFASYQWTTPQGAATWNKLWAYTNGKYTVTVTNTGGQTYVASTIVTIHPQPTVTIAGVVNNTVTNCPGVPFTLNATTGFSQYTWNGVANTNSSFTTSTTGNVTLTVTDAFGCTSNSLNTNLQNFAVPQAVISQTGVLSGSNTVSLTINDGTFTQFAWSTGATSRAITVSAAGTYSVTATTADGCHSITSLTEAINTTPLSIIKQSANTGINLIAQPNNYQDYRWFNVNTNANVGTGSTINVTSAGTYRVDIYQNGTFVTSATVVVTLDASTGKLKNEIISSDDVEKTTLYIEPSIVSPTITEVTNTVTVIPQPAKNEVRVVSTSPVKTVTMYDMNGKVVISVKNITVIDITAIPSGSYQMVIETEAGVFNRTVVVIK